MAQVMPETASEEGAWLSGVQRRFGDVVAVDDVDLHVARNSRVSIVGPSGCGKSTLLSLICGLDDPDRGTVMVNGSTDAKGRLARCAWMPQRDLLLPWRTALANVCLPLENRGIKGGVARERVLPLFERFGLAGFEDLYPTQLSGGMRQRASFLRTLVADKEVLLLDEPFGALDSITRADVQMWLLAALRAEPRTTILVTHDVEEAILLTDEVIVMSPRPGRVVGRFTTELPEFGSRREALTHPDFVDLRESILARLEGAES
jgi:ABC-type nitrate/sulfonate/bicarbonate transport system ATPase subunit